jgi:pimeloyl-ACP methyl ester carboxylesterase
MMRAIVATAALAVAAATGARAPTPNLPPPLGVLVDAGGHRLHVHCTGRGSPPVVVESGTGDFSFDWALVQPGVARFTRICTYDRAGYAWSDPGPRPRTFPQLTLELHRALANLGVASPRVVVGQSFGGPLVRAYARAFPDEVAGMVLVESAHEDQRVVIGDKAPRLRDMARGREIPPPQATAPADATAPALRGLEAVKPEATLEPPLDRLPPAIRRLRLWAEAQPRVEEASRDEREWSDDMFARLHAGPAPSPYPLGDRPLVVLTRARGGYPDGLDVPAAELDAERLAQQEGLLALSRNHRQVVAQAGHNMHLEDPALVIAAIRAVVESARKGTPVGEVRTTGAAPPRASSRTGDGRTP